MTNRILTGLFALLVFVGLAVAPATAAEEKEKKEEAKTEKAEKKEAKADAGKEKVKVSKSFLNSWKNIQKSTKQKAYETQQTRTVAGVRGAEAEDAVLGQLYYKGGVRYPSRVDLKNAITQLRDIIKADPEAEGVPEQKLFIAQCHIQLGETEEAVGVYEDIIKNYAGTDYADQAKAGIESLKETEE